jgi:pimeloyl-ACP methyl ester carboxylesterase
MQQNMFDLLPHIDLPTLIVHGEHDAITPVSGAAVLAESIPTSRRGLRQQRHPPFIEEPDRFNEVLRELAQ